MNKIDYAKVGLKMKELRNSLGISQQTIASDIGSTVAFVSNIENNKVKMNLRMVTYYADMCKIPVDVLLDAGREKQKYTEKESIDEQIACTVASLSDKEKTKLLKLLQTYKAN